MQIHNKKSLEVFRRALRVRSTPAEKILWEELRNGKLDGLKFKRQHSIGNYIVDFYCASKKLIIEADGGIHLNPDQADKDQLRDENLKYMRFILLRFTNDQILNEPTFVKQQISNYPNASPSP